MIFWSQAFFGVAAAGAALFFSTALAATGASLFFSSLAATGASPFFSSPFASCFFSSPLTAAPFPSSALASFFSAFSASFFSAFSASSTITSAFYLTLVDKSIPSLLLKGTLLICFSETMPVWSVVLTVIMSSSFDGVYLQVPFAHS